MVELKKHVDFCKNHQVCSQTIQQLRVFVSACSPEFKSQADLNRLNFTLYLSLHCKKGENKQEGPDLARTYLKITHF